MTNMDAAVLFYNISKDKAKKIKLLCLKMKLRIKEVPPSLYGEMVGAAAGIKGFEPEKKVDEKDMEESECFTDEMLLFKGFNQALLDRFLSEYRRAGIEPVMLKAVLTPHNITWSSVQLYREIKNEHEKMHGLQE